MRALREEGFPITIVRPAHTYGDWSMPLAVSSWQKPFSSIARWRAGKALIVPGDGQTLWTLTHNSDFAVGSRGAARSPPGNRPRLPHRVRRGPDLGRDPPPDGRRGRGGMPDRPHPHRLHRGLPSRDERPARGRRLGLPGLRQQQDQAVRAGFPARPCRSPEGIKQTIAWYDADPARQEVDTEMDEWMDRLIAAYEAGLANARAAFGR